MVSVSCKPSALQEVVEMSNTMPLSNKVDAMVRFTRPVTIRGLQEFVGMANFYRRFIPAAAQIMLPLFEALAGKSKTLSWSEDMFTAFQNTKKALADHTLLIMHQSLSQWMPLTEQ